MEYLQVKTPFIEKWEKEVLVQNSGSGQSGNTTSPPEFYTQYLDYNKLQELSTPSHSTVQLSTSVQSIEQHHDNDDKHHAQGQTKKRKLKDVASSAPSSNTAESGEVIRKELHNAVEKRRRDKINTTITELKELVPNCRHFASNKASVLHHASEFIKQLSIQNQELTEANRRLQESNSHLIAELTELHRLLWVQHHGAASVDSARTVPPPLFTPHMPSLRE